MTCAGCQGSQRFQALCTGSLFLGFAVLALRRSRTDAPIPDAEVEDTSSSVAGTLAVISSIAASIALAEMGDKTQIATATLASQSSPVGVWIGATLGAASSGMVGAVAGNFLGDRVPARALHLTSATLFIVFGVAMLAGWF